MTQDPQNMNREGQVSVVAACDATECRYNEARECHAGQIQVSMSGATAACMTYTPRNSAMGASDTQRTDPS